MAIDYTQALAIKCLTLRTTPTFHAAASLYYRITLCIPVCSVRRSPQNYILVPESAGYRLHFAYYHSMLLPL
jgi:hypothetical protein